MTYDPGLNALVEQLYGSVGKTPDLIDQQGRDYWSTALSSGAKTPADFMASANAVYSTPSSFTTSDYADENIAGLKNLTSRQSTQMSMMPMLPGGGMFGGSSGGGSGGGTNPYLKDIGASIREQSLQDLGQGLNMIRSDVIGTGGFGGSRQGVAEGLAAGRANQGVSSALANLYGTDWTNQQNRDLSRYGMDQGFFTQQRGQDLQQIGLGSQLETQNLQNQWYPITQAANIYGNLGGMTGSTTNTSQQGGGAMGTLGGLLGAGQLSRNLGWW